MTFHRIESRKSSLHELLLVLLILAQYAHHSQAKRLGHLRHENKCRKDDTADDSILSLSLTEEFIKRAVVASELSYIVFEDDISTAQKKKQYGRIYDEFSAWYDGLNDAHLLVKQQGVCYGVFRGTFQASFLDQMQNTFPIPIPVPGTHCAVRKGPFLAHYMTPYIQEFRQTLQKCVQSCPSKNCPLILTGHSQGGAVAISATLDREINKFKPTTIAFGPNKAIVGSCGKPDLDKDRIFTFTTASGGLYDDAPYGIAIGKHVGHVVFLDEGMHHSYVGYNDNKERIPTAKKLHAVELYRSHMQKLADSDCFPITITQWANGHWCSQNDECLSRYCQKKVCQSQTTANNSRTANKVPTMLSSGTSCTTNASCQSGKCKRGQCALANGKSALGASCRTSRDCDSKRCAPTGNYSWEPLICSPRRDLGMWCREDYDCLEENCSGRKYLPYLDRRCQPRR